MSLTPAQQFTKEEAQRQRHFETQKVCFEENSEHLRSLNGLMWQVPLIAMTLTGGLWFGIGNVNPSTSVTQGLLVLVGLTDLGLIGVMLRMRFVFGQILNKARDFHPAGSANTKHKWLKDWLVVVTFSVLLGIAALMSFAGAWSAEMFFARTDCSM